VVDHPGEPPRLGARRVQALPARQRLEVRAWRTSDVLNARERLAAEYAERYAEDHHGIEPGVDDDFWERMLANFTQAEVVELTMSLGSWLAFGRLNRVLGLDVACALPSGLHDFEHQGGH
jgi:alkylhydroperoxidase family enzyme